MIIEIKSNYLILSPVRPLINTFLIWTDQITKDAKYKINNKKKKDKKKKKSVKILKTITLAHKGWFFFQADCGLFFVFFFSIVTPLKIFIFGFM